MSNFEESFRLTIGHEGGFQNDPNDRGNWTTGVIGRGQNRGTKYGITAMSYPTLDIRNLSLSQAQDIYRRDFWNAAGCDKLPAPVAYLVFDGAVNHGVKRSIKFLQAAVGATPDGVVGPKTLAAVAAKDENAVGEEYCVVRMLFYARLGTFSRYGKGWTRRAFATFSESIFMGLDPAAPHKCPVAVVDESNADEDITPEQEGSFWESLWVPEDRMTGLIAALAPKLFSILDQIIPDKDQAAKIKAELSIKLIEQNSELAKVASQVVTTEAQGESWLQRNWRPGLMVWFAFLLGMYWFGFIPNNMSEDTIQSLFDLIQIGVGGYVIGRSVEKVADRVAPALANR